uniref:Retrovirus-related Pol polyprotein from transposon TNT 1-94 n=1 Tax=Tanacetum cinerariifolium TaxID=118510 RepID=A0A6L2MZD1_TANCI|nr:retrovirus-related Pol polyprotein from transposon TNT 1-94 [Tanacetum cinerariifolium]
MQTQTSNSLYNAIMEAGGKDRPPMLAPGNYVQWSRIKRYIDTKPNHELIHYCLQNAPYEYKWAENVVLVTEGSSVTTTERYMENYKNVSQDIRDQLIAEAEAKAIKRLKQGESIDAQDLETNLYWEFGKFTSRDVESLKSYYSRSQQTNRSKGKAIVNSSAPIYDQELATVTEDDEMSKEKESDKLMALIYLSFKKIYKPTNTNLQTSSNTSRANQDNSPRINRGIGYEIQRVVNVAGAREYVEQADWRDDTNDESDDQELEAHYLYMAQIQEVTQDTTDNSGPIFDSEPLQKVQNDDDNYNVFGDDQENPEQSTSVNDPYHYMCYDREQDDQDDTDELAQERDLLASLIKKLKSKMDLMSYKMESENSFNEYTRKINDLNQTILDMKKELFAHQETISIMSQQKEAQIKYYKTREDKEIDKFVALENKVKVLDNIVYKIGQSVQTINMLNGNCKTSFAKPEFLKKAQRANPRLTKQLITMPISTREPKQTVNQSVATSYKKIVTTDSTVKKPRNITRKLYEHVSKTSSWWYPKFTPSGYKWKPKSPTGNVKTNVSMPLGNASRNANILEPMTPGMMKFENDQIAPILGYGDLVQGTITIKRVYYVEGLNHNLFSVGQFYDADLEVAFQKSTCYICDLKGNDLLTGSRGTDLYSITLQDTSSPNPICLMAKATLSQAWLWHRRLSHLNFDIINLLLKYNIVTGLPKLKFIKYHLCSFCELEKSKRMSFHTKTTPSSKRRLQLLHMDLCGPMRVERINGKKYVLVIVDDYSKYT